MTIHLYTRPDIGQPWMDRFWGRQAIFACILGFTETGLIPGISAAGATPADRRLTAIADAEFLYHGPQPLPQFPLPPLVAGASPALISRAVITHHAIPLNLFNAGLPQPPPVPVIDLKGQAAQCLTTGRAMPPELTAHLFQQGLIWGEKLASQNPDGYSILGECVVGGTTTALAVLLGLGWSVEGLVNSSHPTCNHAQKQQVVRAGLLQANLPSCPDPLQVVSAVGDPMQVVVAGMAIAASRTSGVLLAGGTQLLAVYALIEAIARWHSLCWNPEQVVVGTTRWVATDPTGNTVGLANLLQAPLLATSLSFTRSRHAQLRAYEEGFVKEGVGAGGCAIASHLRGWQTEDLREAVDRLADELALVQHPRSP